MSGPFFRLGVALCVLIVAATAASADSARPRPNIIVITVDALRADHLGVYGYSRPTSPAIDAFAKEAVVVSDGISQAPYTKASMASFLTGLYPTTHKAFTTNVAIPRLMTTGVGKSALPSTAFIASASTNRALAKSPRSVTKWKCSKPCAKPKSGIR